MKAGEVVSLSHAGRSSRSRRVIDGQFMCVRLCPLRENAGDSCLPLLRGSAGAFRPAVLHPFQPCAMRFCGAEQRSFLHWEVS